MLSFINCCDHSVNWCNWQVKDQPSLTWSADAHEYYTLVMNGMFAKLLQSYMFSLVLVTNKII